MKAAALTILFICCLSLSTTRAQDHISQPVVWSWETKKLADRTYQVKFIANISKTWHIYSQHVPKDAPATATSFTFVNNPLILLEAKPAESGKMIVKNEPVMDIDIAYFTNRVEFTQEVKLKANVKSNLRGTITYQACTDEFCLPPAEKQFDLKLE